MRVVFLIGFDRSGTSFIGGALERHPGVRYFCQPDSSSPLHRAQWEYWGPGDGDAASRRFLRRLTEGEVDRGYVVSDWFRRSGCGAYELDPAAANVVKSTKLHWKVRWLEKFPGVEVLAVVRDPRATVASLVRNDFHTRWYSRADFDAAARVVASGALPETGLDLTPPDPSDWVKGLSYLVLVRTAVLCADLGWDPDRMVVYEHACDDPGGHLCGRLGLAACDLGSSAERDYNIIGRPFEGKYAGWWAMGGAERAAAEEVLGPLCERLGYPSPSGAPLA